MLSDEFMDKWWGRGWLASEGKECPATHFQLFHYLYKRDTDSLWWCKVGNKNVYWHHIIIRKFCDGD